MDGQVMIEPLKIFRLAIHEEPFTPRVVHFDHLERQQGSLRVASCHELSGPLRRTILQLRQAIVDRQSETGSFVCTGGTTPQSIAEFMLCSHWLGLHEEPSLEPVFSECVDRLIDAQDCSEGLTSGPVDKDTLSSTLLIDFALRRFGISPTDEAMIPAWRFDLGTNRSEKINQLARGYLALYGLLPFEADSVTESKHFSSAEQGLWTELMQRKVHRQLATLETCVAWLPLEVPKSRTLHHAMRLFTHGLWKKIKQCNPFQTSDAKSSAGSTGRQSFREHFYRAMIKEGPSGSSSHSTELQQLLKRLKTESIDALLPADFEVAATCLEALLFSGLSISAPAIKKASKPLAIASFGELSIAEQAAVLRAACLLCETDGDDHALPPEMHLIADPDALDAPAGYPWPEWLIRTIAARQEILLAAQSRDGSWDHCPLVTARVLEALSYSGLDLGHQSVAHAIRFLRRRQMTDGSWISNSVAQQVAVTAHVLAAVRSMGIYPQDPLIVQGVSWLLANQYPGGAWAVHSCEAQSDVAPYSLYDTALSLTCLIDCGFRDHPSVSEGINFLMEAGVSIADDEVPASISVPLTHRCAVLRALCRWVSVDDNGSRCGQVAARGTNLLSVVD